jgi:Zn-dependent membrane protease YugP
MLFFSPYDFLLIPGIILAIYAQSKVKGTYERYRKIRSARGLSGAQVATEILRMNNIYDVNVEETSGVLTDHYDPRSKTLRLSSDIYNSSSIAALGIAAHEAGHAAQHATSYMPLKVRHSIFPIANIGSNLAMPFFLI